MKQLKFIIVTFAIASSSWSTTSVQVKIANLPRLPGATLLVGYPPSYLVLTSGPKTWKLQEDGGDASVRPSISSDGRTVASARRVAGNQGPTPKLIVSTYSMASGRWTDYNNLEMLVGPVAISPDGSKLACITRKMAGAPSGLRVLDLKSGKLILGPKMPGRTGSGISWSPDNRRIMLDLQAGTQRGAATEPLRRAIYVWNVENESASRIADGMSPSWSPSGQWIAFVSHTFVNEYHVSLMHPDSSDSRILLTFHSDVVPNLQPVWSPDSQFLLINKSRNPDKDTWDIDVLDLSTLKLTKRFKNVPPVFGWVVAR